MRKSARQLTQLYDAALAPSGLTIGQFGILAQVYGAQIGGPGLSLKELAQRIGMDPTTLNRALKPLLSAGYVLIGPDPGHWRAKLVTLGSDGETKLASAVPLWQAANDATRTGLGAEVALALGGLLDLATHKLAAG